MRQCRAELTTMCMVEAVSYTHLDVYKRQDLIYYQISIAAKRFFVLRHRNGLCPCFVVTGDPPICILSLIHISKYRM